MPRICSRLLLVSVIFAAAAQAQEHPNHARGFGLQGTFDIDAIDNINRFNGNLVVRIPFGLTYPVSDHLSYAFGVTYNGNNWRYTTTWEDEYGNPLSEPYIDSHPNTDNNAGLGWIVSFGAIGVPPGWSNIAYMSPDGGWHALYPRLHDSDAEDAGDSGGMNWTYTRDGSYIRMKRDGHPWEVQFSDGTVHRWAANTFGPVYEMYDRFGNHYVLEQINPLTTYEPHPNTEWPSNTTWRIRDDWRTHYIHFRPDPYGTEIVGKVELSAFDGTRATYRFNYDWVYVSHPCTANPDPNAPAVSILPILRSIEVPDGSTFAMPVYDTGNGVSCSDPNISSFSGNLKTLTLPTLGKIEWDYQEYQFVGNAYDAPYHAHHKPGVAARRLRAPNGSVVEHRKYQLSHATGTGFLPPAHLVNTVSTYQPDGLTLMHRTKNYFSLDTYSGGEPTRGWYGLPMSRVTRAAGTNSAPNPDGSTPGRYLSTETFDASGALVRTTYLLFDGDADLNANGEVNQRVLSERTVYNDDSGCGGTCSATTDYSSFDGLGHFRQAVRSGNFRSTDGSLDAKTSFTNFNPARGTWGTNFSMLPVTSPWIVNTFSEQSVTEGSSTVKAQFCFDQNNGLLLRQRALSGTTPSANDLLTLRTHDAQGNLIREEFFGGDLQALGTGALCSLALPANQFRTDHSYQYGRRSSSQFYDGVGNPLSFKTVDYDIDAHTGLVRTSRDSAGLATQYTYDVVGRMTWSKPAQSGWTERVYNRATSASALASVETKEWNNGASAVLARSSVQFDGFGRTWRENTLMPNGTWSTKETLLNAAGWIASVSEVQSGTPTSRTQFQNYDPFGRARTIVPPDGTAHQVTIAYAGDRAVTTTSKVGTSRDANGNIIESNAVRAEIRDRHGRLWKVTEPSGAAGANVTTTYGYDAGDRMMQAVTAAAEATQTRTFAYDGRGFLLSAQIPEKPAATTYADYDAAGNPGRKSNAAAGLWDILYTYDRAGRLTLVRSSRSGITKTLKEFTYAAANGIVDGVTDYRNGKLAEAKRHNWLAGINSSTNLQITETYHYAGRQGSVSKRITASSTGASFTQTFAADDLGNRATTGYPTCGHGCPGEPSRSVSFAYTNGHLTSIPGYASSIAYHPNGMVSQVAHANGVTWNQAIAANAMRRPSQIYTSGAINGSGGAAEWNSGTYAYDGERNVVKIGADYFLYDKTSRLIEGTADQNGGATRKQSQTFDSFGNITSFTTNGSYAATGAVSSTNRLSVYSYDANGNATAYGGDTYGWDDLDMMSNHSPSSKGWHYAYTAGDERIVKYNHVSGYALWFLRDTDGKVLREYPHSGWRIDGSLGAGSWAWTKDYIYRDGALLASVDASGTRHFHLDHLGTPRLTTNQSRVVKSYNQYYAFGIEATSILQNYPNAEERMKFTGHERDLNGSSTTENTDYLDYMHARYYHPLMGRFLTLDPADADPARPQSWNRYAYVLGNPLKFVDPDGEEATPASGPTICCYSETITVTAKAPANPAVFEGSTGRLGFMGGGSGGGLFGNSSFFDQDTHGGDYGSMFLSGFLSPQKSIWERFGEFMAPEDGVDLAMTFFPGGKSVKVLRKLGPSGKPAIHQIHFPTRKQAKDAARNAGHGRPMHHPSPKRGKPHYHPTTKDGKKVEDGTHYNYPGD